MSCAFAGGSHASLHPTEESPADASGRDAARGVPEAARCVASRVCRAYRRLIRDWTRSSTAGAASPRTGRCAWRARPGWTPTSGSICRRAGISGTRGGRDPEVERARRPHREIASFPHLPLRQEKALLQPSHRSAFARPMKRGGPRVSRPATFPPIRPRGRFPRPTARRGTDPPGRRAGCRSPRSSPVRQRPLPHGMRRARSGSSVPP